MLDKGISLRRAKDLDGAIAAYSEAIRLGPNDGRAYAGRGIARTLNGQCGAAIADLEQAVRLRPTDAAALAFRGSCYAEGATLRKGWPMPTKRSGSIRNAQSGYFVRGSIYAEQGTFREALADLDTAVRLDPEIRGFPIAQVYGAMGNDDQAIADATRAIHLEPNRLVYVTRAMCQANKERLTEAIADMDAAVRLGPGEPCHYEIRGGLWALSGNYDRAIADFQAMMRLNPKDPAATSPEPTKLPLPAEALKHGRDQLRRMLHDRPAMAKYGPEAGPLCDWAACKFAAGSPARARRMERCRTSRQFSVQRAAAFDGPAAAHPHLGEIRRRAVKSREQSFEGLWGDAVFGLCNVIATKDYEHIEADAAAGRLSRTVLWRGLLRSSPGPRKRPAPSTSASSCLGRGSTGCPPSRRNGGFPGGGTPTRTSSRRAAGDRIGKSTSGIATISLYFVRLPKKKRITRPANLPPISRAAPPRTTRGPPSIMRWRPFRQQTRA